MKKSKIHLLILLMTACAFLTACKEDILSTTDPDVQLELDLVTIADYITAKGYTNVDTTASGAFYVILEEGTGGDITPNSIVSYQMAGKLTDGFLWATNIDTVAINADAFDSTRVYEPFVISYTVDGWNIPELIRGYRALERGYRDGIAASLGKMNVGGRAQLIVPSGLAYASSPPFGFGIPSNSVIIYDIYPTYVRY